MSEKILIKILRYMVLLVIKYLDPNHVQSFVYFNC